jgi:hypothetical protein
VLVSISTIKLKKSLAIAVRLRIRNGLDDRDASLFAKLLRSLAKSKKVSKGKKCLLYYQAHFPAHILSGSHS